jgi:hypothetical protein
MDWGEDVPELGLQLNGKPLCHSTQAGFAEAFLRKLRSCWLRPWEVRKAKDNFRNAPRYKATVDQRACFPASQ